MAEQAEPDPAPEQTAPKRTGMSRARAALGFLVSSIAPALVGVGVGLYVASLLSSLEPRPLLAAAGLWLSGLAAVALLLWFTSYLVTRALRNRVKASLNLIWEVLEKRLLKDPDRATREAGSSLPDAIRNVAGAALAAWSTARAFRLLLILSSAVIAIFTLALAFRQLEYLRAQVAAEREQLETQQATSSSLAINQILPELIVKATEIVEATRKEAEADANERKWREECRAKKSAAPQQTPRALRSFSANGATLDLVVLDGCAEGPFSEDLPSLGDVFGPWWWADRPGWLRLVPALPKDFDRKELESFSVRLVSLASTLVPRVPDNRDTQWEWRLSPERAHLVLKLARVGLSLSRQTWIGLDLSQSDFRNLELMGLNLVGASLAGSSFRDAAMSDVQLAGADLRRSVLPSSDFFVGSTLGCWRVGAASSSAELEGAVIPERGWLEAVAPVDAGDWVELHQAHGWNPQRERFVTRVDLGLWKEAAAGNGSLVLRRDSTTQRLRDFLRHFVYSKVDEQSRLTASQSEELKTILMELEPYTLSGRKVSLERLAALRTLVDEEIEVPHDLDFSYSGFVACYDGGEPDRGSSATDFSGARLDGVSLAHAVLEYASFRGTSMNGVDLRGALLPAAAAFEGAELSGVNLEGALVNSGAWLDSVDASASAFDSTKWRLQPIDTPSSFPKGWLQVPTFQVERRK